MQRGKKSTAARLVYDEIDMVGERTKKDPMEVFEQAVKNVSPVMEVKPRRVGGATYQVPMEVPAQRRFALATRWILQASVANSGKSFLREIGRLTNRCG
jgi:small subunit ribosomal protein S7